MDNAVCNLSLDHGHSMKTWTHGGQVTHICVSKLTIIGSDKGLLSGQCQTIIWMNAGILLIRPLAKNLNEILIEIHTFSFKKILWKMAAILSQPQCVDNYSQLVIVYDSSTASIDQGWGILNHFPPFWYFSQFSALWIYMLAIEYHIFVWQVLLQLCCGDTCQA